jgi:hypothetical protein
MDEIIRKTWKVRHGFGLRRLAGDGMDLGLLGV